MKKNYAFTMSAKYITLLLFCLLCTNLFAQTNIVFENFEDNTVTFATSDPLFHDGSNDYFHIVPFNGPGETDITSRDSNHFGAEDMDDGLTRPTSRDISWSNIDVSTYTSVDISAYFAESNSTSSEHWDPDSSVRVQFSFGAGNTTFFDLIAFESSNSSATNTAPRQDTNFDGVGDGIELTNIFSEFSANLNTSGQSILNVRILIENLDSTQEDIAIDDFNIDGNGASNAAPVATAPSAPTVSEDAMNVAIADNIQVADTDGDDQTVTFTITGGTLTVGTAGISFGGAGNSSASFTAQGSLANINAALDAATFTPTPNLNGTNAGTIAFTSNDGTDDSNTASVTFNISAVNDNPTVTGLPASVTVTEDTQSNVDLSAASFADVDSASITVTLTASAGTFATPADGAGVGGGVTETLVSATVITLVGAPADINTYLDTASNIQYTAASNVSGNAAATITVTANDGDGSGNVNLGTVNINVTPVNDDPTITGLPASVTVTEDTQSNVDLSAASFADIDSASITVTLTASAGTFASPADGAGVGGGVTETLVSATVITLVGAPADINTYLDTASNIQYTAASNVSGNAAATITVTANDGDGSGNVNLGTVNINVTEVNDAPVFSLPGSPDQSVGENSGAQTVSTFTTSIDDGDANAVQTLSFNVSNDNNALFSAQPAIDASGNLTYTPATNTTGTAEITVSLSDNGGTANGGVDTSADQTFDITISDMTSPIVTISSSESPGPTGSNPIPITVTFSESVTGFDITDLVIGNGTEGNFSGSGDTYTFDINPTASGAVTVDIAANVAIDGASNGNTAATQFSIMYDNTLGLQDDQLAAGLRIYPMPSNTVINIATDINLQLQRAEIFDITGKIIYTTTLDSSKAIHTIDTATMSSGMYILTIHSTNAKATKRIVIE